MSGKRLSTVMLHRVHWSLLHTPLTILLGEIPELEKLHSMSVAVAPRTDRSTNKPLTHRGEGGDRT